MCYFIMYHFILYSIIRYPIILYHINSYYIYIYSPKAPVPVPRTKDRDSPASLQEVPQTGCFMFCFKPYLIS